MQKYPSFLVYKGIGRYIMISVHRAAQVSRLQYANTSDKSIDISMIELVQYTLTYQSRPCNNTTVHVHALLYTKMADKSRIA